MVLENLEQEKCIVWCLDIFIVQGVETMRCIQLSMAYRANLFAGLRLSVGKLAMKFLGTSLRPLVVCGTSFPRLWVAIEWFATTQTRKGIGHG